MANNTNSKAFFNLQETGDEFSMRSKDVFSNLGFLEDKHNAHEKASLKASSHEENPLWKAEPVDECKPSEPSFKKPKPSFKKPKPAMKRPYTSIVPDFKKRPEKWTQYSLVNTGPMSEESNRQAAKMFLEWDAKMVPDQCEILDQSESMELPREATDADGDLLNLATEACSKGKIMFKKPTKSAEDSKIITATQAKETIDKAGTANFLNDDLNQDFKDADDEPEGASPAECVEEAESEISPPSFKQRRLSSQRNIRVRDTDDDKVDQ